MLRSKFKRNKRKRKQKKTILMDVPISITIWQSELIILPLEKNQYKKQIKTKSKVLSVEIILTQNNIQLIRSLILTQLQGSGQVNTQRPTSLTTDFGQNDPIPLHYIDLNKLMDLKATGIPKRSR
jgi:hypothetical protein